MPEERKPGQPAWTDFHSFVANVRATCDRFHAPQPTLEVLELEYPQRCAELARFHAWTEVQEAREQRSGLGVAG